MEQKTPLETLDTPFSNIALCFSGGGFRAAAFALGVLSYLERCKYNIASEKESTLLDRVTFISSASGGTITNLVYGMHRSSASSSEAFRSTFRDLYVALDKEYILESAVDILFDTEVWNDPKRTKTKNIINAFSLVYDKKLFKGETFSLFQNHAEASGLSICLNTTEFTRGISFRFQHESDKSIYELSGNRYIKFSEKKKEQLGKIKLADILAASSCFPSGFEPMVFPNDFVYTDSHKSIDECVNDLQSSIDTEDYNNIKQPLSSTFALMDGGITDNQAIQSAMLADRRRRKKKKKPFDLIITNDVTSYFMDPYKVWPPLGGSLAGNRIVEIFQNFRRVFRKINITAISMLLILLLSLLTVVYSKQAFYNNVGYFMLGVSCLGLLLSSLALYFSKRNKIVSGLKDITKDQGIEEYIAKIKHGISPNIVNKLIHWIKNEKIGVLYELLNTRINSVLTMAVEVNLKHARRLIYAAFFDNPIWENKRLANFIYDLSHKNLASRNRRIINTQKKHHLYTEDDVELLMKIPDSILNIADVSRQMGTTLWFGPDDNKNEMLHKIIQCGQFTTCLNLLEYTIQLIRKKESIPAFCTNETLNELVKLKSCLESDWNFFIQNPAFLLKENLQTINGIPQ